jgi:SNF2 family DNA or RNA helicase
MLLLFSQMNRMLDLLEDYFALRALPSERLDGSVSPQERLSASECDGWPL